MNTAAGSYRGGSGTPLLLLHSGFHTWVEFRSLIRELEPHRDVLAVTLPGSAGGPPLELRDSTLLDAFANHVEAALDDADWTEPVSMVGSSYGGVTAIELGARGRARDVVALAPPWPVGAGLAFYGLAFAAPLIALRVTEPVHGLLARGGRLSGLLYSGSPRPPELAEEDIRTLWQSVGRFPFWRTGLASGLGGPGKPDPSHVRCPVTLAWGTTDRLVPHWMRARWEEALPDAHVETLDGFPHQPHLRDPKRVAELILSSSNE
jgi:pimeloyl-ACP methyl ester carboxylesterase